MHWHAFFSLFKATSLGEGKLQLQTSCIRLKKLTFCHPARGGGVWYIYLPTFLHKQDARQCLFFRRILTGWNWDFSFSLTGCHTKVKEHSQSNYLTIAGGRIVGFIHLLSRSVNSLVQVLNSDRYVYFLRL